MYDEWMDVRLRLLEKNRRIDRIPTRTVPFFLSVVWDGRFVFFRVGRVC
jgi:hypothetical protein